MQQPDGYQKGRAAMVSAVWIWLCVALVAGYGSLLLCRAILQPLTRGIESQAADGLRLMALDSSLSLKQRSLLVSVAWSVWLNTPDPVISRGRFPG